MILQFHEVPGNILGQDKGEETQEKRGGEIYGWPEVGFLSWPEVEEMGKDFAILCNI